MSAFGPVVKLSSRTSGIALMYCSPPAIRILCYRAGNGQQGGSP
jgi:hypothetical protein